MEIIGKLLEYGILGMTTGLFLILWLRERKESNKHIDKRIEISEKVIPVVIKSTDTLKQFGKELHEGLEAVRKKVDSMQVGGSHE